MKLTDQSANPVRDWMYAAFCDVIMNVTVVTRSRALSQDESGNGIIRRFENTVAKGLR
jgi:hypothetical protein